MAIALNPYLNFSGNAREAMDFYQSVFGGEVTRMVFADIPMPGIAEADMNKIMHSQLNTENGLTLMCSDVPEHMGGQAGPNSSVSLSGPAEDGDTLRGYFEGLADGGTVNEPLTQAPWGDSFGMLVDRFGVPWMVNIAGQR